MARPGSETARMQVEYGGVGSLRTAFPTQSGNSDEPGGRCGGFRKLEMLQDARGADLGGREGAMEAGEGTALCCTQLGSS